MTEPMYHGQQAIAFAAAPTMPHTAPAPDVYLRFADGTVIQLAGCRHENYSALTGEQCRENARRIAALWNFCDGITTDALEGAKLLPILTEVQRLALKGLLLEATK